MAASMKIAVVAGFLLTTTGLAQTLTCDAWAQWQAIGEGYTFEGQPFVDELRERECRAGSETWTERMSRSRALTAVPMQLIYGGTETGVRVVGLSDALAPEEVEALLSSIPAPLLLLVTPRAAERFGELLAGHPYLVLGDEGLALVGGALELEALYDALSSFERQRELP